MKTYSPFYSPFVNRFDPESSRRVKTKDKEERIYRSTVPLFINNDSKRGRGCTNRAQLLPNVTKREKERGEGLIPPIEATWSRDPGRLFLVSNSAIVD